MQIHFVFSKSNKVINNGKENKYDCIQLCSVKLTEFIPESIRYLIISKYTRY